MEDLYDRLGRIGLQLAPRSRLVMENAAQELRRAHRGLRTQDDRDDLLEIADRLDALAKPIAVTRR